MRGVGGRMCLRYDIYYFIFFCFLPFLLFCFHVSLVFFYFRTSSLPDFSPPELCLLYFSFLFSHFPSLFSGFILEVGGGGVGGRTSRPPHPSPSFCCIVLILSLRYMAGRHFVCRGGGPGGGAGDVVRGRKEK